MSAHNPEVSHQFEDLAQQKESATLGMWAFLITEVLFFGGLFTAYIVYRTAYPAAFALASHQLDIMLGAVNTAVLLASSLTMAMAVHGAQEGKRSKSLRFLLLTGLLGFVFLGIKAVEYAHKFEHHLFPDQSFQFDSPNAPHAKLYFALYFTLTGMHALHMIIGIGILAVILRMAMKGAFTKEWHVPVEIFGLYWHFVDIVWIFLFPLLYLVHRHG